MAETTKTWQEKLVEEAKAEGIDARIVEPPVTAPGTVAGSATVLPGIRKPKPEPFDEASPLRDDDGSGVVE